MLAARALPSQYFLSPVYEPSTYITNNTGGNATLTSNSTAALLFWTQNTSPDSAVDRKICVVGGSSTESGLCLDQWGDNVTQVALQAEGDFTGQLWNQTYWTGDVNGSKAEGWRLHSEFAGKGRWLAVAPDGSDVIMSGDAPFGHTMWRYVDPAHLDSSNANGSEASSTTGSASSSSASADAGPESVQSHSGLSGGAIAGIVVGVVVALVAAVLAFLLVRRRRQRRRTTHAELPGTSSTAGRQELASDTATTTNTSSRPETSELSGQSAVPRAELP